jgi:3-phosphoshikimate 1-carboxyvinyltransferase
MDSGSRFSRFLRGKSCFEKPRPNSRSLPPVKLRSGKMYDPESRRALIRPAVSIIGVVDVPSDKSIAHRSALFAAIADGTSRIVDYPVSEDPVSTLKCLKALGVEFYEEDGILVIEGKGPRGLKKPEADLPCGNSGTTMRLLSGILAGQSFSSKLSGDASLCARDMTRIATPLRKMGARVTLDGNHAPISFRHGGELTGINYTVPIPSAQVKSCILLAGLYAKGETTVVEYSRTRDHTERMLGLGTVRLGDQHIITVDGGSVIQPRTWSVPRDFSAAAFFLVAGSVLPDSAIRLPRVGINPSRTGLIDVLRAMGARIELENERITGSETIADLVVFSSGLSGIELGGSTVADIIDEIPILAVAATQASGRTVIREASELRHKETDRISAIVDSLRALGADIEEFDDGFAVTGGPLSGGTVNSHGDHRIAMAMGVAGLVAQGDTTIEDADVVAVSFPSFWPTLRKAAYGIEPDDIQHINIEPISGQS